MTTTDGRARQDGSVPRESVPPRAVDGLAARTHRPRRRWPRITAVAVVVGILAAAVVIGVSALLPPSYTGRVGLLALPTENSGSALLNQSGVSTSYGEVVSLAMPSISDVVASPTLLDAVSRAVPGSPSADDLASGVSVELLSGSGVARVSVAAADPAVAGKLAEAVGNEVIRANLLAPAGELRLLDPRATVLQTSPDMGLATGIALIAGLVAAGAAVLVMRPFRARPGAGHAALEAVTLAGRGPATLLDGDDPALVERARVLVRAADRPVRVVGASPGVADSVLALQSDLATGPRTESDATPSVLVVVDRADARREDVDDALGALPEGAAVLAVVVV
ncbi:hypothetical protein [Pseudonocardia endophytica]|uniref:Capsular polysaccharide biosynthesis protein n=1 Tax=Pseudonocardia endophytica TaxID=401976 RepID=A0A4R1HJ29_PSEEN|nr:hypothetical protein [Pseudonocardia endophytica]TCK20893.1 capsular polysaccharide biosynthesis protein [Pseudonocardia endophytica]